MTNRAGVTYRMRSQSSARAADGSVREQGWTATVVAASGRGRLVLDDGAHAAFLKARQFALFDSAGSVVADDASKTYWDPAARTAARLAAVLARTPSPKPTEIHHDIETVAGHDSLGAYPLRHVRIHASYRREHVLGAAAEIDGATVTTVKDFWFAHIAGLPENALTPMQSDAADPVSQLWVNLRQQFRQYGVAVKSSTETSVNVDGSAQVSTVRLEILEIQSTPVADTVLTLPSAYVESPSADSSRTATARNTGASSLHRWLQVP